MAMVDSHEVPPARDAAINVAALDLGSNSFHLLLAQADQGEVRVVDRIKERVALASGFDSKHGIAPDAKQRALECLARFSQRLVGYDGGFVRAVGTNTMRSAKDGGAFLAEAERTLGYPIELVSGAEEARLIYAGVRFASGYFKRRICAIDIGGGSTELVVGKGKQPELAESLRMGCVVWSERFFPDGQITEQGFEEAIRSARLQLRSLVRAYRNADVDLFVGSSGTALSIAAVIDEMKLETDSELSGMAGHFSRSALMRLKSLLIEVGSTEDLDLKGLSDGRVPVIAGGVALMIAVFDALRFERMAVSEGALREGLLAELVGHLHHEDSRDGTILAMAKRLSVDMEQAGRVASTAALLFEVSRRSWGMRRWREGMSLRWAALLHEVGMSVNHNAYRKHGSYLVTHADLAGFTQNAQERLAALVYCHRGRMRTEIFDGFRAELRQGLIEVCLLLRIARILHRSRSSRPLPAWAPKGRGGENARSLELGIPKTWCEEHPLTRADLEDEVKVWEAMGWSLSID